MANPFRKVRGIPDRILHTALTDHQQNIAGMSQWAFATERRLRWLERIYRALMIISLGLLIEALGLLRFLF